MGTRVPGKTAAPLWTSGLRVNAGVVGMGRVRAAELLAIVSVLFAPPPRASELRAADRVGAAGAGYLGGCGRPGAGRGFGAGLVGLGAVGAVTLAIVSALTKAMMPLLATGATGGLLT